ncbi:hypothetical protein FE257_001272 [Aspergillus nanangensis]|uniref:Xylanolytic transcriptional activator regulatory domain-containing protein n=1 Tax=Aspergillus nanangensis TaxID=2582783 RepID=A0AAD4CEE1_ASPNN|nr:hypothetical protein FE257_001272 [Aspergillus nanangensis]
MPLSKAKAITAGRNATQGVAAGRAEDAGVHRVVHETNLSLPAQVLQQQVFGYPNIINKIHSWISLIPLTDAQLGKRHQVGCLGNLAWSQRQALESAIHVARQVSNRVKGLESSSNDDGEKHQNVPSIELLTWIVKDVGSDTFGPYVLDYFKHVDMSTLKRMGLSLVNSTASPVDSALFTVCVNAVASKFLTTVLMADDYGEQLTKEIRKRIFQCCTAAQRALKEIRLLTPPSLALLQALLCGIFLHQRFGDTQLCSDLTRTACRVCIDLGLPDAVNQQQATEEEYYCVMWCYMMDRSYAWKLGRSRYFIDFNARAGSDSLPRNFPVSELLHIYITLAQVQDSIIPFLGDASSHREDVPSFYSVREQLLPQMEIIRSKIDAISSPSPMWRGLDVHSEIAAMNFAYHSVRTTLLHVSQVVPNQHLGAEELYLQSARQELSALVTMCLSSDNEGTAAFLHWTLLFWPLTACFVLFSNAVAASDLDDFTLLKAVANVLLPSSTVSQPVATLQRLFQDLVSLAQGFFTEPTSAITAGDDMAHLYPNGPPWPGIIPATSSHDVDPSDLMHQHMISSGNFEIEFLDSLGGIEMEPTFEGLVGNPMSSITIPDALSEPGSGD